MIMVRLIGGLGNQMFQYAAGRALSLRQRSLLHLDVSDFDGYVLHNGFELSKVFACNPEIATEEEVRRFLGWRASPFTRKILLRPSLALLHGARLVVEPCTSYWPGIGELSHDAYLVGYWQSEKYFSDASAYIRADFAFRQSFSTQNAELAGKIGHTMAVSLHVRRGDYVSDSKTQAVLGLCSLEYYRSAIMYIADHVVRPEFFIFSDDVSWVKDNLEINFPCTYVSHNCGAESYNDMRLMSLCRHHIIANSSFSWWGAWLNQSSDKIVVAPRKWFAKNDNVEDIFPAGWVTL